VCTVGRAADCRLRLPNEPPDLTASRHHCAITLGEAGASVRDLGSRNGTFLNGESIGQRPRAAGAGAAPPELPARPLHDGDSLRVGRSVFRVSVRAARRYDVRLRLKCARHRRAETSPAAAPGRDKEFANE